MDNGKKLKPLLYKDHKIPMTRREFLAAGLIESVALVSAPTLMNLLSSTPAHAAIRSSMLPVFELNAAGGAAFNHQTPPLNAAGSLLSDYAFAGRPGSASNLDETLGMPFFADSELLAAIKATASPGALNKVRAAKILAINSDDTSSNPFALSHLMQRLKTEVLGETYKSKGLGKGGPTGGSHSSLEVLTQYVPLDITNYSVVQDLFTFGGAVSSLSDNQKTTLARAVRDLSGTFNFGVLPNGAKLRDLVGAKYADMVAAVAGSKPNMDPRQDPIFTDGNLFDITGRGDGDNRVRDAAIVKLTMDGVAPVGTMAYGGYDYHTSEPTTHKTRETELGTRVGRILEALHRAGKAGLVVVSTDGTCTWADRGGDEMVPVSDGGQYGVPFLLFAIGANGAPEYTLSGDRKSQRGFATNTGRSDSGLSPAKAFATVMATYLNLIGHLDKYGQIWGGTDPLTGENLANLAIFKPIG